MPNNARFAEVDLLAGEPARAGMLHALMDGRVLTASELAHDGGLLTDSGRALLVRIGMDIESMASRGKSARVLCRPCID